MLLAWIHKNWHLHSVDCRLLHTTSTHAHLLHNKQQPHSFCAECFESEHKWFKTIWVYECMCCLSNVLSEAERFEFYDRAAKHEKNCIGLCAHKCECVWVVKCEFYFDCTDCWRQFFSLKKKIRSPMTKYRTMLHRTSCCAVKWEEMVQLSLSLSLFLIMGYFSPYKCVQCSFPELDTQKWSFV